MSLPYSNSLTYYISAVNISQLRLGDQTVLKVDETIVFKFIFNAHLAVRMYL